MPRLRSCDLYLFAAGKRRGVHAKRRGVKKGAWADVRFFDGLDSAKLCGQGAGKNGEEWCQKNGVTSAIVRY
jgi:hypothetical protein